VWDDAARPVCNFAAPVARLLHDVARMESTAGQNRYAISSLLSERFENGRRHLAHRQPP